MEDKLKTFKPNTYARQKVGGRVYMNASITEADRWELKSMATKNHLSLQDYLGMIIRNHVNKYDH